MWKSTLPEPLRWDDSEPPSTDINAARLRAKYYGARYIIHRPFIYHALHKRRSLSGSLVPPPPPSSSLDQTSDVPQRGSPATSNTTAAAVAAGEVSALASGSAGSRGGGGGGDGIGAGTGAGGGGGGSHMVAVQAVGEGDNIEHHQHQHQQRQGRGNFSGGTTSLELNCRKCIESAVRSTTAFHAFDPDANRPIITNVFGTAHA